MMADHAPAPRIPIGALGQLTEIGVGGQGRVYRLSDLALTAQTPQVFKRYDAKQQPNVEVLADLVGRGEALAAAGILERLAWPTALVVDAAEVVGFIMPAVSDRFALALALSDHTEKMPCQGQHLLNDDETLAKRGIPLHDSLRLELLRDLAQTMQRLHHTGVSVGDFSPNNIFLSVTSAPRCFLIDCDGVRVVQGSVLPQAETPSWEVPAGEELATPMSDAFKFALFAIRLFAGDQDSREAASLNRVSPQLVELARAGLATDPEARPQVGDWLASLEAAIPTASMELPAQRYLRAHTQSHQTVSPRAPSSPAAGSPFPPPRPAPRRGGVGRGLLIAGIVIAVCLVGSAMLSVVRSSSVSSPPRTAPTRTGSDRGYDQARALEQLILVSGQDRGKLNQGIGLVDGCSYVSSGISAILEATHGRQSELDAARELHVDALPDGDELKRTLITALEHSLAADQAFLAWAMAVRDTGCAKSAKRNADYNEGLSHSDLADEPKQRFVDLWNPVASKFGFSSNSLRESDV